MLRALMLVLVLALPARARRRSRAGRPGAGAAGRRHGSFHDAGIRLHGRATPTRCSTRRCSGRSRTAGARADRGDLRRVATPSQDVVVDRTVVEDAASARDFGARLMAAPGGVRLQRHWRGADRGGAANRGQRLRGQAQGDRPLRRQLWNRQGRRSPPRATQCWARRVINGLAILCAPLLRRARQKNLEQEYAEHHRPGGRLRGDRRRPPSSPRRCGGSRPGDRRRWLGKRRDL